LIYTLFPFLIKTIRNINIKETPTPNELKNYKKVAMFNE